MNELKFRQYKFQNLGSAADPRFSRSICLLSLIGRKSSCVLHVPVPKTKIELKNPRKWSVQYTQKRIFCRCFLDIWQFLSSFSYKSGHPCKVWKKVYIQQSTKINFWKFLPMLMLKTCKITILENINMIKKSLNRDFNNEIRRFAVYS